MNYAQIVNLIFNIIFTLLGAFYLHFIFFAIIGIFKQKKFPKAKTQHKFAVVVSARNEELVIGNLIKSIRAADYPKDKLDIFIVAHNCEDKTAEICRKISEETNDNIHVYEYNNAKEKTKGYALKYLFNIINRDYADQYEGYFIFDADNIVKHNYFEKMNDAFEANPGNNIIMSFINAKNFGTNVISGIYGLFFLYTSVYELRGRTALGCSTRIAGTGFLINSNILKDGWNYTTIAEDFEFTIDQVCENHKIVYCYEAETYDEQPTKLWVFWRQRLRWEKGFLTVFKTRYKQTIKALFSKQTETNNRFSVFNFSVNLIPLCLLMDILWFLQFVLLLFSPLFKINLATTLGSWGIGIINSIAISYVLSVLSLIPLLIIERKKLKYVNKFTLFMSCLAWPLFLGAQFIIDIVALFKKEVKWKPIPHQDTTNFEKLNSNLINKN